MVCANAPLADPIAQPISTTAWNFEQTLPFAESIADPHNDLRHNDPRHRDGCGGFPKPTRPMVFLPIYPVESNNGV
jgi:hypothetical protein